jgi:hypothetical protein
MIRLPMKGLVTIARAGLPEEGAAFIAGGAPVTRSGARPSLKAG